MQQRQASSICTSQSTHLHGLQAGLLVTAAVAGVWWKKSVEKSHTVLELVGLCLRDHMGDVVALRLELFEVAGAVFEL
jgi:hypothetical protein